MKDDQIHKAMRIFLILLGTIVVLYFGILLYGIIFHGNEYGIIVSEVNESITTNGEIRHLTPADLSEFPALEEIIRRQEDNQGKWDNGEQKIGSQRLIKEDWDIYRHEFTAIYLEYGGKYYKILFSQT